MALAGTLAQRRIVVAIDDEAARLGLTTGMTVTHANSLVPGLTVFDATPDDDEDGLVRLAHWCLRYSPLVTASPPDGIFIDVAGSAHLFNGEAALIDDLIKRLAKTKITATAAIADTPGCAWAVARFGDSIIVPPGRGSDVMASLPVRCLRLSPHAIEALRDVGLERVAQLAAQPRGGLSLRFGAEVLYRLDQAFGRENEALTSIIPVEVPVTELRFAEPVGDPTDLQRIVAMLCEKLCTILEDRGVGARRLDLCFVRVDNITQAVRIGVSRPYREPKHLAKLLHERLQLVDPGFGIERVTLTASWVEALSEQQTVGRHVEDRGPDADLGQLVDTLSVRFGPQRVFRLAPVESDVPERSVKRIPAMDPPQLLDWPTHLPRPARLFERPERIKAIAELPDHPPRQFIWQDQRFRVVRADGPERIRSEWWKSDAELNRLRDYYRVQTGDGARYWLFRDGPAEEGGSWWLHGIGEA